MYTTSPTSAGFSLPSISTCTATVQMMLGPRRIVRASLAFSQTREPTGTGLVKRTFSVP